jgi:hypothetical protein
MIRTEREFRRVQQDVKEGRERIQEAHAALLASGLEDDEAWRAISPMAASQSQAEAELAEYEETRAGHVGTFDLAEIGRYLVKLRIAKGWSPRRLADALGVDEAVISRDERDEYRGISKERIERILDALDAEAQVHVHLQDDRREGVVASSGGT